MSLLSELKPYAGSKQVRKRLGRGKGSGKGGTSGKGHKGQKARKGVSLPAGFEGGTMPLSRRLPKFGFGNKRFQKKYEIINLSSLEKWQGDVDPASLFEKGLINKKTSQVKILANGLCPKGIKEVKAHKFSKKAKELIEKAGGQAVSL